MRPLTTSVYNPVSLMKCFMNEEFKNYYTLGYPNLEISQSFSYWLVENL